MNIRILNIKQVRERTSLSAPTVWRKERRGEFPARRQISANRVGWVESEIDSWLSERVMCAVVPKKVPTKRK